MKFELGALACTGLTYVYIRLLTPLGWLWRYWYEYVPIALGLCGGVFLVVWGAIS